MENMKNPIRLSRITPPGVPNGASGFSFGKIPSFAPLTSFFECNKIITDIYTFCNYFPTL
jgi:hypothetical protein